MKRIFVSVFFLISFSQGLYAKNPEQIDSIVTVKLENGLIQQGILTMVKGDMPENLVLLFPGDPAVLQPEVSDGKLVKVKLKKNPLVRARHLLVKPGLATVLIDCRSDPIRKCKIQFPDRL